MFFVDEKRDDIIKEILNLFMDKISIQSEPPQNMINFSFGCYDKNLNEVKKRLEEMKITNYTVEEIDDGYKVSAKEIVIDSDPDDFVSKFKGIVFYWMTNDCYNVNESNFRTYVIETKNEDIFKLIVKRVLNMDIESLNHIDIVLEEYDIDGLSWTTIDFNKFEENKINESKYLFSLYLTDCLIDHFQIWDIDGKLIVSPQFGDPNDKRKSGQGFRIDLNNLYRSKWEANFARILKYLEVPFEYEANSFLLDYDSYRRNYYPDFFLPNNKIIEIKGFWNTDSRQKVKAFVETHPEYELMILDGDMYTTLEKIYAHKIPNWEFTHTYFQKDRIPVIGITRPERRKYVEKIEKNDTVQLIREKNNPYDPYAIKVLDINNNHIGYVATVWAYIYASKMDIGMTYEAVVKKIEPKVITIQVKRTNIEEIIVYDFLKEK